MPRIVVSTQDNLDVVEHELMGDELRLTTLPLQGGYLIVLGNPDFVACYDAKVKAVDQLTETRHLLMKALEENELLNAALKRVQGRCYDLLMENRKLKGQE